MLTFRFLRWSVAPLLLACTTLASADCRFPYWSEMAEIPSEVPPEAVATGDLNGDAKPDLVVAGHGSVAVVLNAGGGAFGAPVEIYSGTTRDALVLAELTGGGGLDIAIADATTPRLIVLPGNGNGTFGAPVMTTIPAVARMLATADFDEDDKNDLLYTTDSTDVRIYRGTGNGNFAALTALTVPSMPTALVAADLDGDEHFDIASGAGGAGSEVSSRTELFFGNGNGTFTSAFSHPAFYGPTDMHAADVDQDGKTDLVAQQYYGAVAVMRNLTGRTFGDPLVYSADGFCAAVGELTGDAHPDVLAPGYGDLVTYAGTDVGTLRFGGGFHPSFLTHNLFEDAALADFDGDGRLDAALAGLPPVSSAPENKWRVLILKNECGALNVQLTTPSPVVSSGQEVTLTVKLHPPPQNTFFVLATGTLTLRNGDTVLDTQAVGGDMQAHFTVTLPLGTHTLTASYDGDDQHDPAVSAPLQQKVVSGTTTTSLSFNITSVEYGQVVRFDASVTSTLPGTPAGKIRFTVDGTLLPYEYDIADAPADSIYYFPQTFGTHTVTARYEGDAQHPPSTSAAKSFVYKKQTPAITLTPASVGGQPFGLTIYVQNRYLGGGIYPGGTITASVDSTSLGTRTLSGTAVSFQDTTLSAGRHVVRVDYSGDERYAATTVYLHHVTFPDGTTTIDARGTASAVTVNWYGPMSIIRRRTGLGPVDHGSCCPGSPWIDENAQPGTVYVYFMESHGGGVSGADVAQRISFTDDPLVPGKSIRALHLAEVVAGTNKVRAAAGLAPVSLTNATSPHVVTAVHVNALRTAINEARAALGAVPYSFPGTIAPGAVIRATHIQDLREAIR